MNKKSRLGKKAASVDELPIEENPFFLDAAAGEGGQSEEVIRKIAQEIDGQLEPEEPDESVHVDDFVIPVKREMPEALFDKAVGYCGSLHIADAPAEEDEIFAVLENRASDEIE